MTVTIITKEALQIELDAVRLLIDKKDLIYYHISAIQNFVYHLDNIQSEQRRARTASSIHDYLLILAQRLKEQHELRVVAKELYPHVWQISQIYRDELGFVSKPYYPISVGIWLFFFAVLNYFISTWFAILAVVTIAIASIVYKQIKVKALKVC